MFAAPGPYIFTPGARDTPGSSTQHLPRHTGEQHSASAEAHWGATTPSLLDLRWISPVVCIHWLLGKMS